MFYDDLLSIHVYSCHVLCIYDVICVFVTFIRCSILYFIFPSIDLHLIIISFYFILLFYFHCYVTFFLVCFFMLFSFSHSMRCPMIYFLDNWIKPSNFETNDRLVLTVLFVSSSHVSAFVGCGHWSGIGNSNHVERPRKATRTGHDSWQGVLFLLLFWPV
jgi:hypothetical protein